MMGMTPNEAELNDVESHYPTDRIPMEMKEKSVAENLLDKMSETQSVFVYSIISCLQKVLGFVRKDNLLQILIVFPFMIVIDALVRFSSDK